MPRQSARNLLRRLGQGIEKHSQFQVEIISIDDSIDAGDDLYWAMVQLEDGQSLSRVRARGTKMFPGNKYYARPSALDGILEIFKADEITTKYFFDGLPDPLGAMSVANHAWTHRGVNGLDPLWVEPQQVLGGQARPVSPNSLYVYVTPCPPLNFAGNSVDMTAYLPSAGMEQIAIISIDYTTRALAITTGGAQAQSGGGYPWQGTGSVPFNIADVEAIAVDNNHIRLAAVRLYANQTEVKWSDIFLGLRDFAGRRTGYVRLDDDDPTIDGLIEKITGGAGIALSRETGDSLVISATGGGGSAWNVDAVPDDASALDDEFADASFDTGLWTEYDPAAVQTIVEASDMLSLSQASQSSSYLTGVYQAIPAGDFTLAVKMRLSHTTTVAGMLQAGFALWVDPTDSAANADFSGPGDASGIDAGVFETYFTAYDTIGWFSTNAASFAASTWYYLRLRRNGGNYIFDYSTDGETWTSVSVPPVNTPAYFGIGILNNGTSVTFQADFEFFRYRNVFDSAAEPVHGAGTQYVRTVGDAMTGKLSIAVATADESGLEVQSTDDDPTNMLFIVSDSVAAPQITLAGDGAAVFNEAGNNADFRIESDNNTALFFANGSTDRIGINNVDPLAILDVVGAVRFGDSLTNYLAIDTAGQVSLVGTARVKIEIIQDAQRSQTGAAKPTATVRAIGASGGVRIPVDSYSKTTQNDQDILFHSMHDTDGGVDVTFHLIWIPGAAWTAGNYMWKLEYLVKNESGNLTTGAPTTIQADVTPSNATDSIETEFVSTIDLGPDQLLCGHFYRDVANDNADDVGEVMFFEIEYTANSLGEAI